MDAMASNSSLPSRVLPASTVMVTGVANRSRRAFCTWGMHSSTSALPFAMSLMCRCASSQFHFAPARLARVMGFWAVNSCIRSPGSMAESWEAGWVATSSMAFRPYIRPSSRLTCSSPRVGM